MKLLIQEINTRSRESVWAWLFFGPGTYLVLEVGALLLAKLALNRTVADLAGPYLAFAVPALILLPLVWWLRKWEGQGASPKRLARGWGLSMVLFGLAVEVAFFYSGIKLGRMAPSDALGGFVVPVLLSVPTGYFTMHHVAITRISSRAGKNAGSSNPI